MIATMDNCMIAHNCNVNAVAFKSSHVCANALILCARRAESVINDFDAKDGIAGSDAGT